MDRRSHGNTYGLINHSRYLPDRRDLNWCFPGSETGSLAARLANRFFKEVVARADIGNDLRSAAIHRTNYPQVRISPDDEKMQELAEVFGAPMVMKTAIREGSLRDAAQKIGQQVLLFEGEEGLRFGEIAIRAGVACVLRVLNHHGTISRRGVTNQRHPPSSAHQASGFGHRWAGCSVFSKQTAHSFEKGNFWRWSLIPLASGRWRSSTHSLGSRRPCRHANRERGRCHLSHRACRLHDRCGRNR